MQDEVKRSCPTEIDQIEHKCILNHYALYDIELDILFLNLTFGLANNDLES